MISKIEEIKINNKIETTITFTEEMVDKFAQITNDHHPLHVNRAFALENGFKNKIVHGMFISSVCVSIIVNQLIGENMIIISQNFKYNSPVLVNEEVHIICEILKIEQRFKIVEIKYKIKQKNVVACTGKINIKLRQYL